MNISREFSLLDLTRSNSFLDKSIIFQETLENAMFIDELYGKHMRNERKMGGMLKEDNFGSPVPTVQEIPKTNNWGRLKKVRNL